KAYPSNVLHFATECGNKGHSAAFPRSLPEWFIKLFTDEEDWVLDPFVGSGTTCASARGLRRNSVGIDLLPEYYAMSKEALNGSDLRLFEEPASKYAANNGTKTRRLHRKAH